MIRQFAMVTMFLVLVLAPAARLAAQNDRDKAVREVLRQMIDADLKDDAAELDRTLAPDYVIVRDNGVVRSRAETLEGIKSGATKFTAFDLSDVQVRFYGDTVATFHANIKGSRAGKDMSGQFVETRIFVSRGGSWRAVLAQRTRITGN